MMRNAHARISRLVSHRHPGDQIHALKPAHDRAALHRCRKRITRNVRIRRGSFPGNTPRDQLGIRELSLFAIGSSQPMQRIGKTPVNLEGNCVSQMVRDFALTTSHFRFVGPLNGRGKGEIKEPIARLPLHTTGPREHSSPEYGIGAFAQ